MMKKITGTVLAGIVRSPCMTRLKASEASISADIAGTMRTSILRWTPTPTLTIDQKQEYEILNNFGGTAQLSPLFLRQ